MKTIKYIMLCVLTITFISCETDDNIDTGFETIPELTSGSADFSTFVSVGASFTAGVSDNGLFRASQENSFPNTIAKAFSNVGGGEFLQPLVDDNTGGILVGGATVRGYRLVFGGSSPIPLDVFLNSQGFPVPQIMTEAGISIGSNYNNFGIPGAKSFDLTTPGFAGANPYYARMASAPTATVLQDAVSQNPSFFTLSEIGGNDVLGYATTGGNGSDPITDPSTFSSALTDLVNGLTENGAKGAIGNVPNITSLSFFTTAPHNPLDPSNPAFGPQIPTLNATFASLNGAYAFLGVPERSIVYSETEASPVIIHDESLPNIAAQLAPVLQGGGLDPLTAGLLANQFGQSRQATADDLLTLTSASVIATLNEPYFNLLIGSGVPAATAGQLSVNGVTFPLEDTFVLLPSEQLEIANATMAYNTSIQAIADEKGLALVDLNSILEEAASTGIEFDGYVANTDLVTGGLISLDGVHLTAKGYALMANSFLKAIDTTYGSNFEASRNLAKADDFPAFYSPTLQ